MAKKRIRILSVRMTTTDDLLVRRLARLAGCSPSELIRELVHTSARAMHLLEPLQGVPSSPSREGA